MTSTACSSPEARARSPRFAATSPLRSAARGSRLATRSRPSSTAWASARSRCGPRRRSASGRDAKFAPAKDRSEGKLLIVPTSKRLNVAVVGVTGIVGQEMLKVLAQRGFPAERVVALASERSKGLTVPYNGSRLTVEPLHEDSFKGVD